MENSNRKRRILYVLFGVGLGIIISSTANIMNPSIKLIQHTDEEIKEKARELGMVDLKEYIEMKKELDIQNKDVSKQPEEKDNLEQKGLSDGQEKIKVEEQVEYLRFTIKKGDSSQIIIDRLFEAGLIDDKDEFKKAVIRRDASKRFIPGDFDIVAGSDYDSILDIISK